MRWYVRRDAPMLRATVDRFLPGYRAPDNQDAAFERIYRRQYRVHNPLAARTASAWPRCARCCRSMVGAADRLAEPGGAGLQGVHPQPGARHRRCHGLMQITPSAAQRVGVSNTATVDGNVQASADTWR
jgi:membrane-bound lytic murein transglycosylase MltF